MVRSSWSVFLCYSFNPGNRSYDIENLYEKVRLFLMFLWYTGKYLSLGDWLGLYPFLVSVEGGLRQNNPQRLLSCRLRIE